MIMKRPGNFDEMSYSKRPRLEDGGRQNYAEGSARLMSEWDNDDMDNELEAICIGIELSQQPKSEPVTPVREPFDCNGNGDVDLAPEVQKLKEDLKTKEGEVGILRSQLGQLGTLKQNEALNHRKMVEQLEMKYKTELRNATKKIEQMKGELEFKEMEVQGLKEKCKQNENQRSVNFVQPSTSADRCNLAILSQSIGSKPKTTKENENREARNANFRENIKDTLPRDGDKLCKLLGSEIFRDSKEPNILEMSPITCGQLDEFDYTKNEKYKWSNLPKDESFLRKLNPFLADLIQSHVFPSSALESIHNVAVDILKNLERMLLFLTTLPKDPDFDIEVFKNSDHGLMWDVQMLISPNMQLRKEQGVEARRILGVLGVICKTNPSSVATFTTRELLTLLGTVVELIGRCKRVIEYSAVMVACLVFIQTILTNKRKGEIDEATLSLIGTIISNIILSRSKLDVLREVLKTLGCSAHHPNFVSSLCKTHSSLSFSLYMDARLQQANFFTRDVCPIKLLQYQVKVLAHLCTSKENFLATFKAYIHWLESMTGLKRQIWLFPEQECCDVFEGFCYLIEVSVPKARIDSDYLKAIESAIIVLRDCTKGHLKKFKLSTSKKLTLLVRNSGLLNLLSHRSRAAAMFIVNSFDKEVALTQDSTAGANVARNFTSLANVLTS